MTLTWPLKNHRLQHTSRALLGIIFLSVGSIAHTSSYREQATNMGIFEGYARIGSAQPAGSLQYDAAKRSYTIDASRRNGSGSHKATQFAWKKAQGDASLAASIKFLSQTDAPGANAYLMIRQSLSDDSSFVAVTLLGDGSAALQFRYSRGERIQQIQSNIVNATYARLEKRGLYARMYLQTVTGQKQFSGAATRIEFSDPYYIGIAVTPNGTSEREKVEFSEVDIQSPLPQLDVASKLYSTLETQDIRSMERRIVHVMQGKLEAPNWLADGRTLIYNSGGRIYRIPLNGGEPRAIDTGFANQCNNDHGVSPDGKLLVVSDQSQGNRQSIIYTLPIAGGAPKQITRNAPSYWHGWSPDGKTLVYCAQRNGQFDVYSIPAGGGEEIQLTNAVGLDDGPEYSPDGKYIYFHSDRTGNMHIYRMKPDGKQQVQLTNDEYNDWFAHPAPDGKSIVYISFERDVAGHPENKDVLLRQMNLATKRVTVLARLFGGQGTANVPNWSPNGRQIAFVTYQLIP